VIGKLSSLCWGTFAFALIDIEARRCDDVLRQAKYFEAGIRTSEPFGTYHFHVQSSRLQNCMPTVPLMSLDQETLISSFSLPRTEVLLWSLLVLFRWHMKSPGGAGRRRATETDTASSWCSRQVSVVTTGSFVRKSQLNYFKDNQGSFIWQGLFVGRNHWIGSVYLSFSVFVLLSKSFWVVN